MSDDSPTDTGSPTVDPKEASDPFRALLHRAAAVLESPKSIAAILAVACLPLLLTLLGGLTTDDHYQCQMVRRGARAPWDLFRFTGSPQEISEKIRRGEAPWFFAPDGKGAFLRPLASVGHWLEYRVLGSFAGLAHLHNLIWFAALIATAWWVFSLFENRRWTAGLATIIYACSPATAVCAAWIAARNSLMAATFGFAALGAHHLWRTQGRRRAFPTILFLLALASSESAAGPLAYLLGYAMFFDRGGAGRRLSSVAPYLVCATGWYWFEHVVGYGSAGNVLYTDVRSTPAVLASLLASRVVKFVQLELGWTGIEVLSGRFEALNGASIVEPGFAVLVYFLLGALALGVAALRNRESRFWLASSVASMIPFCLVLPQPRLLLAAHFGVAIGLARSIRQIGAGSSEQPGEPVSIFRAFCIFMLLAFSVGLGWPCMYGQIYAIGANTPTEEATSHMFDAFAGKDVVCVNCDWFVPLTAEMIQEERGSKPVRSLLVLASSPGFLIERPDYHTLVLRSPGGLLGLGDLFRSRPFRIGDHIKSARCDIEILATNAEQRPTAVQYVFDTFLEAKDLAWTTTFPPGVISPAPPIPIGSRYVVLGGVPILAH